MTDDCRIDQRGQMIRGSQTNIINIVDHEESGQERDLKETKALLTARLKKQENGKAILEIKNIGQAIAWNIRVSFSGRTIYHSAEGENSLIPGTARIPVGESILIPIECSNWRDIYVSMWWMDDSGKDNENRSYIILK